MAYNCEFNRGVRFFINNASCILVWYSLWQFLITLNELTSKLRFWQLWQEEMCWVMARLAELELSCKHSLALVTKWCFDISIDVVFTWRELVNLYTTLDFKAAGVLDFRLKYDPVFSEVWKAKIRSLPDDFSKYGKPSMYTSSSTSLSCESGLVLFSNFLKHLLKNQFG